VAGILPMTLGACQALDDPSRGAAPSGEVRHEGVEARPLDDEIVTLTVRMSGPATRADLVEYAACAAAGYALLRGYGFARHVRTNVQVEGGVRIADAVYTVSPTLPRGLQTIDAETRAFACAEQGIPTV
jgi:hypothetical protein